MDSVNNNIAKLVMTLLVRNEEDIIRYNIDFHLSKGVDFIIATDNGSTDSTRDILMEYEEKGVLHLIDEKNHNHNQAEWNNRMAGIARDQYGADIIFHCDADEFWYPRSGNLKDEISNRAEDILCVDVVNVLLEDKGGEEAFPEDTKFAVVNPVVSMDYQKESRMTNMFYFKYPSKVIFTPRKKVLLVSQGNHTVTNKDDSITEGKSQDIVIYHYPIRSKSHFFQKTIFGGSVYENSDIHSKDTGFHKRRWYASYKEGLLDEEYKKLILHEGEVDKFMREGFIEEIDFNNVILGHENKDNRWRYFNRKFEYEDMFQDFYWPWAGHKYFAYDLIRNIKPKVIVELGTHKGTSFYSFCQAVKDACYDANLYAVDTWRGDEHTGFYDDNVFKKVQEIKEKYYGGLKVHLLREPFNEAVGKFENNSIALLHIDGLHTYPAVKHDFDTWFPKVKKDGIILLHDISISRDDFGVYKFWEELKSQYKTIEFHQSYGLGVLFKDSVRCLTFIDKEREWQIRYSCIAEDKKNEETSKSFTNFEKSLAERNGQVANLNQDVAERKSQIASLNQVVAERDGQITSLNQVADSYKEALRIIEEIRRSSSWRITEPMRYVSSKTKNIAGTLKLLPSIIRFGGGVFGSARKAWRVFSREGWCGVKERVQNFIQKNSVPTKVLLLPDRQRTIDRRTVHPVGDPSYTPKISIITPLYNTKEKHLREMLESVISQTYSNWELCLADGSDQENLQKLSSIVNSYASKDVRIKYKALSSNGGIAANTIEAFKLSAGDYALLLDHDDLLAHDTLLELRNAAEQNRDVDFIYADRSIFSDETNKILAFHYLPGFSPDYLRSCNYASHLNAFSRYIINQVGFEQSGYDGSQDYEFELRVVEKARKIVHIPKVLYHCRACVGSVAMNPESKMYAYEGGRKAIEQHIHRIGYPGKVDFIKETFSYRIHYKIDNPLISIIIPNMDHLTELSKCIDSILQKTTYQKFEIIVVENNSKSMEIFDYYKKISTNNRIKILYYPINNGAFNFSAINNWAVTHTQAEYILLLNNDTEVISPNWLEEMLMFAQRRDVGAVGAKLYYPNNTNQHTGLFVGLQGHIASSYDHGKSRFESGYMHKLTMPQNYSAVTAACLMVKRSDYLCVKGLDEEVFKVGLNDIDFCLKLVELEKINVVTPFSELYHFESTSRKTDEHGSNHIRFNAESKAFRTKWRKYFESGDKYDNPNFITLYR